MTWAKEVAEQHYDLGNDHDHTTLEKHLNYTCADWKEADNLDDTQETKLDLACRKISAHQEIKNLELGCEWGNFLRI